MVKVETIGEDFECSDFKASGRRDEYKLTISRSQHSLDLAVIGPANHPDTWSLRNKAKKISLLLNYLSPTMNNVTTPCRTLFLLFFSQDRVSSYDTLQITMCDHPLAQFLEAVHMPLVPGTD